MVFSVKIQLINSVNLEGSNDMAEYDGSSLDVREALILAGIEELEARGTAGFSLRRVANACGVSCAAPYKHFKDKDAFFDAIAAYVDEKWSFLAEHISAVIEDSEERLLELCLASVRFSLGNPHFRAVRMIKREGKHRTHLGEAAEALFHEIATARGAAEEREARALFALRSLVAGATLMLEDETLSANAATFALLKDALRAEIKF